MSKLRKETRQTQSERPKHISFLLDQRRLGSFLFLMGLLLFSACRKGEDPVISVNQQEFNTIELQIISIHLQNAIAGESDVFSVLDPKASAGVTTFYEYLDRNYQALVNTEQVVNREKLNWSIHILQDDEKKNTFITPGGAMYITTGMLKTIQSEHELINILAHEISYADEGIVLEKLKGEYGGDVLFQIIAGNNPPELAPMAKDLPSITYSENEVLAADSYGVDIICDFLYDPHGMRDFLKRTILNEESLDWMQNRPSSEDRHILVEQSASGCGPGSTFETRYQEFVLKLP